jgi:REP element-mobilizing transposase RayT
MSLHSYSRVWLHLVWATLERRPFLARPAAVKVSGFLSVYASKKSIYMKVNYVNADHVHALIDLPTGQSIEDVVHLLKGSSSHWINENNLAPGKFAWGRGYGAFSVGQSGVEQVARYIAEQDDHHRKKSFAEEIRQFVERYGLTWRGDGNR